MRVFHKYSFTTWKWSYIYLSQMPFLTVAFINVDRFHQSKSINWEMLKIYN